MSAAAGARACIERAEALLARRDVLAARECFHEAERLGWDADHCCGGRWLASMLAGEFEAAWRESDALRARGAPDPHRYWNGQELQGKRVIVRSLHGLGDAIQMLRFAPELAAGASSVVYEVPPSFVELATCLAGVNNVVTWGKAAPVQPPLWDVQLEVMELPYILRLQPEQLPFATRYLRLPEREVARVCTVMSRPRKPRVGLVWTCGEWNLARSLPVELLDRLLANESVEFWSLEDASHSGEAQRLGLSDVNAVCGDGLLTLAATVANLDLVITVDTLAAHLAGALDKPVWLLLQHAADWRWMVSRADSPWYPTMRIFRQQGPGDWAGLLGEVNKQLHVWAAQFDHTRLARLDR